MEQRAAYELRPPERPRLVVVKDGAASYSALPHAVIFDRRLLSGEVRLYAAMQAHWWQKGECFASHATLAAEIGVSVRQVRRYLDRLIRFEHVSERSAGERRSKAYAPAAIGHRCPIEPVNETSTSDSEHSNRTPVSFQSDTGVQGNRTPVSDSYKKTPEKKTTEENRDIPESPVVPVVGASSATAAATDRAAILRALSDEAREVLDWWRECHGKKRSPSLNPTQARLLEEAVAELGVDRLKESVAYMAGKGVPEIDKARTAAFTKRQQDQDNGIPGTPLQATANGPASKVTPATTDDLAVWERVLTDLRGLTSTGNFETYLAPLTVGGRNEAGGLCLIVPPTLSGSEMLGNFRPTIRRALMDAGDPAPTAVAFKARRSSREQSHAE